MISRKPLRFARLAISLMLAAAAHAAAGGAAAALPVAGLAELPTTGLATLPDYLAAFEAVSLAAEGATPPGDRPGPPQVGPSFQLRERLLLSGYRSLELDLGVELNLPLYSARAATSASLSATGAAASRHEADMARASARVSFLGELASFAMLHQAERELAEALGRLAQGPFARQLADPPAELAPEARPLREQLAQLGELRDLVSFHLAETVARLARTLARPETALSPLSLPALLAHYPPYPADLERCFTASPAAAAARLREGLTSLTRELQAIPDLRIELSASLEYASASGPSAAIALHATLPLPDGWPFSGQLSVDLDQRGASQTLRLSWPNPATFGAATGSPFAAGAAMADPDATLAGELDAVATALRALAHEHHQAKRDRDHAELRLLWLLSDAASDSPWGLSPDPTLELQAAELRVRLAFTELQLFTSGLALRLACGERPGEAHP